MARRTPINVCFHGIGTPGRELEHGEADYWIGVDQYEEILDEVAAWPNVRISFDDGNASDLDHGLEPLQRRGLDADFFVLVGRLGTPGSLDGDDVLALRDGGMRVGTHGMDHRPWVGLSAEQRRTELVDSRAHLEALLGDRVIDAALPLGAYDRQLLGELRRLNYRHVYTSDRRPARAGAWMQPRYSVRRDDDARSMRHCVLERQQTTDRLRGAVAATIKSVR